MLCIIVLNVLTGALFLSVGVDLTCNYSPDFGSDARLEWKFQNLQGSLVYVIFNGKLTGKGSHCLTLLNISNDMSYYCFDPEFLCNCFNAASYASRVTQYGNNLRFTAVTDKDSGIYICEVSSQSQYGDVRVKLTVLGKVKAVYVKISISLLCFLLNFNFFDSAPRCTTVQGAFLCNNRKCSFAVLLGHCWLSPSHL